MHIPLPGGDVEWTAEEAAIAMRNIADALAQYLAAQHPPTAAPRNHGAREWLREFLDSDESFELTASMRSALQLILHRGRLSSGDLADAGVFRRKKPGAPPSESAVETFRTRVNRILVKAGLTFTYSKENHEVDIVGIE